MKQPTGKKRGAWFWVGVVLLSISALWWLILIALHEDIGGTVSVGLVTTIFPILIGIYCVRRGRKHLVTEQMRSEQITGDRHKKLRRGLYFLIPFAIIWVGMGISMLVRVIDEPPFGIFLVVAIFSFGGFFLYRTIRSLLLDLRQAPAQVEGLLLDKRRVLGDQSVFNYYLRIDILGFDLRCGGEEWRMVNKGDRVEVVYYRHSKYIESIRVLEKASTIGVVEEGH